MYVCHHVSNVRIYHAEIMDLKWKSVINNGVAICHLNTTAWSSHHVAYQILGFGPGKIEGCHRHMRYVPREFKEDAEKDKNIILGDFVHYSW
ncbi:hypothetical protein RYX36_011672 [Vicia faba]